MTKKMIHQMMIPQERESGELIEFSHNGLIGTQYSDASDWRAE